VNEPKPPSSYLQLLPAIYGQDGYLGEFLLAFEQVLTGVEGSQEVQGLEQTIAGIARLFQPAQQADFLAGLRDSELVPAEFLHWLSGWVALSLRADWSENEQRAFLAAAPQLYRRRGTADALVSLLRTYTGHTAIVDEGAGLPEDERGRPHHFHVTLWLDAEQAELERVGAIARGLIDLQKPAHATYVLEFRTWTMQIRDKKAVDAAGQPLKTARVGVDTTLTRFEPEPKP
jgi:phage tail-like protein